MGIRQTLNENPSIAIGATAAIILLAIGIIIWEIRGGSSSSGGAVVTKAFFTDDDGKTYFPDDATKLPPYTDDNQKTAVSAIVYKCASGPPFVLYLQRYTTEGRQKLEQLQVGSGNRRALGGMMMTFTEVKKPGHSQWVKFTPQSAKQFNDVMHPVCPDNSTVGLEPVLPQQ